MDTRSPQSAGWSARILLEQIIGYGLPIGVGGVISLFVPQGSYVSGWPIVLGVLAGLPCALALWLPMSLLLRSPGSRSIFSILLVAYCLFWVGPQAFRLIDRRLESSPAATHTLRIIGRERPAKGRSTVTLAHWLAGEEPFEVDGWGEIGGQVQVYTHSSLLGFDWIEMAPDVFFNERLGLRRGAR